MVLLMLFAMKMAKNGASANKALHIPEAVQRDHSLSSLLTRRHSQIVAVHKALEATGE